MIYILIPVYNESGNLGALFKKIKKGMERNKLEYKIVAYNDGSTDDSLEVLESYVGTVPLEVIGLQENKGLGTAFKSLLLYVAKHAEDIDIAVVMDSDNTHNPEHVFQMVEKIQNGFDLVIASRYRSDSRIVGLTKFRKLLSFGASILMRVVFPIHGVRDYTCGYRAYRVGIIQKALQKYGEAIITEKGFACMAEFLIKLQTLNLLASEVPLILRYDFKQGASKMDIKATITRTLQLLMRLRTNR